MYDYLIVGAGLFGSVFAHEATLLGKKCLVIDKRSHIGGNLYTEERDGINIHVYGAHIFHTANKEIWQYMQKFCTFNNYINSPVANYKGEYYNLPFNMNTFVEMWGPKAATPECAEKIIESQRTFCDNPRTLEEQGLALAGKDIYEKLIKGYTEKQWGTDADKLPASILKRVPFRFRFDNNYFNDRYQGIPEGGYTRVIEEMLEGCDVVLNTDYNADREAWNSKAKKVLYTGTLDSLFDFCYGKLAFRSEKFEHKHLDIENFQGVAVVNYTDRETPYTRCIEHKHFEFGTQKTTWISYEYPVDYSETGEPYYPVNNDENNALYEKYKQKAEDTPNLIIGGRLAEYKYYDMDKTVESALSLVDKELKI